MKNSIIILIFVFASPLFAFQIEGRFVEDKEQCYIKVNENLLSGKKRLPVKCKMALINKYKYQFTLDSSQCPAVVKKIAIIPPGVEAKSYDDIDEQLKKNGLLNCLK